MSRKGYYPNQFLLRNNRCVPETIPIEKLIVATGIKWPTAAKTPNMKKYNV